MLTIFGFLSISVAVLVSLSVLRTTSSLVAAERYPPPSPFFLFCVSRTVYSSQSCPFPVSSVVLIFLLPRSTPIQKFRCVPGLSAFCYYLARRTSLQHTSS